MPYSQDSNIKTIEEIVQESSYSSLSTQQATAAVIKDFNQGRVSIMTSGHNWLFKHRLVMPNELRLVELNGIPELVGSAPYPMRRERILNFRDSSSTIGIFNQNTSLIGANGHYVINVPPGHYAKIFDGNKAILLSSGQHVIHSNNFRFNPHVDLVKQTDDYIGHNDLHILRVPQGKVAVVRINNETMFLEHRKEPYLFKTLQFELIKPNPQTLFSEANSKILYAGTNIRLLPDAGEVGVLNSGGRFKIVQPVEKQVGPIHEDIGTARFDGFLSTSLQNVEFPSEAVRNKNLQQGIKKEEANFDYFYTADQVKVGVRFLVNYRIQKPELTLSTLKLADIRAHIESVVTADMGNAIKKTSMQNLLSSDLSKIVEQSADTQVNFNHWQDTVKMKLKEDLAEYGIELIRLNIEEAKILNSDIEQQMSQQAVIFAKAHAQKLSLQANLDIKKAEAEQLGVLSTQKQKNDSEIAQIQATAKVKIATSEAEALRISTDAEVYTQKAQAQVLQNSPQAMLMSFLKIFADALRNGHFSSALPLTDLSNIMTTFMSQISKVVATTTPVQASNEPSPAFFQRKPSEEVDGSPAASDDTPALVSPTATIVKVD
jgi:regulator of protease activity HflC (stomatin/prohibitin superfamily)